MRASHERLSFSFDICNVRYDELDVTATTRAILDAAQVQLRRWIGQWLRPVEPRPLAITSICRRHLAFHTIEVTSPPTVPGRLLTYLVGLTLAADRTFCKAEATRLGLIVLRGPRVAALAELRALPIRHLDEPWLVEWNDADADALCLAAEGRRLVAGQLDAATRRRIDDARATGCGDDPLSARVFLEDQTALAALVEAGDDTALADATLLHVMTPATLRAVIASARHHGADRVFATVDTILTDLLVRSELDQALALVWDGGEPAAREVVVRLAERAHDLYHRSVDGRVVRRTVADLDPRIRDAMLAA